MYWIRHAKPDFGVHGQSRPLTKEAQQTTNENTNGLLEQFSQKKTNLAQVNNEENCMGHLPTKRYPPLVGKRAISSESIAFVLTIRLIQKTYRIAIV